MASGTAAARAAGRISAIPSATRARAPGRSFEPFGSPPESRISACAPIAAASSTAFRLSSMVCRQVNASALANMPPRHSPVTVMP